MFRWVWVILISINTRFVHKTFNLYKKVRKVSGYTICNEFSTFYYPVNLTSMTYVLLKHSRNKIFCGHSVVFICKRSGLQFDLQTVYKYF